MKKILLAVLASVAFAVPARADVVGSGSGFSIPDNTPAGVSSTITFTENLIITGNVVVTLTDLTHTWVGDVTATLIAPDNTAHDLFFRIGRVDTGFGDSSDFGGTYFFSDGATGDIWAEAAARTGLEALTPGGYRTTTVDSGAFTTMDSVFAGMNTQGTWTLFMSDLAGGDTGALGGWTLSMSAVPEPSAFLVLCGLGMAFGVARRRR